MNITVHKEKNIDIHISQQSASINVGRPQNVNISLQPQSIDIRPRKSNGIAFEFVQKVVAGANVVRCTYAEFQSMERLDGKTWYAVTTTADELRYLYLGATLIAKASDDGGTWGFAYTFPITFGR